MKFQIRTLIALVLLALISTSSQAQLPDNSYAPNFSLVDIDGTTQVLYNYTNAGKAVILDISAVWCGPCWSYHQSGALETAFNTWGPSGTDELMVLWIEGDQNPLACLQGSGCGTQGDWTAGTSFPMMLTVSPNSSSVVNQYAISYFPTIYVICPDRTVSEVGQLTANNLHAACLACPPLPTTTNDVMIVDIVSPITSKCATGTTPMITIQNQGNDTLTSLTLVSKVDGVVNGTKNWVGSLARFDRINVTMPVMYGVADGAHEYTIEASLPNGLVDEDTSNNTMQSHFGVYTSGVNIQIKVTTDDYPEQVSWKLFEQGTNNIVMERDELADGLNSYIVCLGYDRCYTFTIYDANNNGMSSPGMAQVLVLGNEVLNIPGTSYTSSKSGDFCMPSSSIAENDPGTMLQIYPNPFNSDIQIDLQLVQSQDVVVDIYNVMGECVYHFDQTQMASGDHSLKVNGDLFKGGIYIVRTTVGPSVFTERIECVR
jgi:hypothetical protein